MRQLSYSFRSRLLYSHIFTTHNLTFEQKISNGARGELLFRNILRFKCTQLYFVIFTAERQFLFYTDKKLFHCIHFFIPSRHITIIISIRVFSETYSESKIETICGLQNAKHLRHLEFGVLVHQELYLNDFLFP